MPKYTGEQLTGWTKPPSNSEQTKLENSARITAKAQIGKFGLIQSYKNQKSMHCITGSLLSMSNILYNEIRYIKSKFLGWLLRSTN